MFGKKPKEKKQKNWFVTLLKWSGSLVLLALLSGYGWLRYDYWSAAKELDAQVALAKTHGFNLTAEDMRPKPPVKFEDNAAPIYRTMFAATKEVPKLNLGEEFDEYMTAAILPGGENQRATRAYLDRFRSALELAVEASKKPRCDFERDWSDPVMVMFPELAEIKTATKLLCARATLSAREGNYLDSVADLRAALSFSKHIEEEKTLIAALVGTALESICFRALCDSTSFFENDVLALESYAKLVKELPEIASPLDFLKAEVYFGYQTALSLKKQIEDASQRKSESKFDSDPFGMDESFGIPQYVLLPPIIESKLCERAYAARYLTVMNQAFSKFETDPDSKLNFGNELDRVSLELVLSKRPSDMLLKILFPVFSQFGESFVKRSQTRQAAAAYIEVLRYKKRIGRLPKSFVEATINPIEPYANTEIYYRQTDNGFQVYGGGLNRKDDGGYQPGQSVLDYEKRDLPVFSFPAGSSLRPSEIERVTKKSHDLLDKGVLK